MRARTSTTDDLHLTTMIRIYPYTVFTSSYMIRTPPPPVDLCAPPNNTFCCCCCSLPAGRDLRAGICFISDGRRETRCCCALVVVFVHPTNSCARGVPLSVLVARTRWRRRRRRQCARTAARCHGNKIAAAETGEYHHRHSSSWCEPPPPSSSEWCRRQRVAVCRFAGSPHRTVWFRVLRRVSVRPSTCQLVPDNG